MLQGEHSAIRSTLIKLPFVIKICGLSFFNGRFTQVLLYVKFAVMFEAYVHFFFFRFKPTTQKHIFVEIFTTYMNQNTSYIVDSFLLKVTTETWVFFQNI